MTLDWQRIEITGRPADVLEPNPSKARPSVVLFLHDFDAHTLRQAGVHSRADAPRTHTVCPIADRSWWTTVPCPDFDATISPLNSSRESVVPAVSNRWQVEPQAIACLGIGMGGQGVLQLAYRWPRDFPTVAAIAPAVDFHSWYGYGLSLDTMFGSKEAARQETATLHIHPLNWPKRHLFACDPADEYWFEGSDRLAMKLSSMGIPFERDLTTSAGGHDWRYFETISPTCALDFISGD